jgi:hypothetical protein
MLMALGALVGVGTGVAVLAGVDVPGVGSWLVAVAVAKLGFIAALALIAAGAMLRRVASHSEQLPPVLPSVGPPAEQLAGESLDAAFVRQRDAVKQERRNTPP